MSDTKRYRACGRCRGSNRIVSDDHGGIAECPDCGHGDCAPGVVDAGVVWSREWPEAGSLSFVWHPQQSPRVRLLKVYAHGICGEHDLFYDRNTYPGWWFTPYAIPAPPKE